MSQKSFRMIDIGSKRFQFISVLNVTNNYLGTYLVYIFSYFFSHFRLSYYPHRLEAFTTLLKSVFGDKSKHYAQRFLEYFKLKPIVEYTFEMIKSVCQVATIMTNEIPVILMYRISEIGICFSNSYLSNK